MGQGSRSWYAEATPPESARRARSYRARDPCVRSSRRRCSRSVSSAIRARSRVVAARVLTRPSSHAGTVAAMATMADLGVKELLLADERRVYFTTPHFDGYPAVLMRIPDLARIDRDELEEMVVEAWLTRAQKRVAKAWLAEKGVESPTGQGGRA